MDPKVIETINLYYKEGSSDKFYVASIQEQNGKYSVPVTWGRQGTSGQSGYKIENTSLEEAQKAYNKVVKEKTGKGYKVSSEHTPPKIVGLPTTTVKRKIDWKEQTLLPQLLNEIEENEVEKYINNPEYCAQEKYDGRRRLLRYQSGKTEGLNKKGQSTGYPETLHLTCKEIEKLHGWNEFIIDGEEIGTTLYAFDLLSVKNDQLSDMTYNTRYNTLKLLNLQSKYIQVVKTAYTTKEKQTLYETLKNTKKEGIVFKLLNGTHKAGYSNDQKKFKFYATASVIVTNHNKKNSIAIAVWDGKDTVPVGNVTTIGHVKPPIGTIIEVSYLYAYKGGSLYQPSFIGVRDDMDKEDCLIHKLKFKETHETTDN